MSELIVYVAAMASILIILSGWLFVQWLARRFAARHPEYGPSRECLGCGLGCACEEADHPTSTEGNKKE